MPQDGKARADAAPAKPALLAVLDDDDHVFLRTIVSQAAQALDRARHFESERAIAETLQRSVLAAALPRGSRPG